MVAPAAPLIIRRKGSANLCSGLAELLSTVMELGIYRMRCEKHPANSCAAVILFYNTMSVGYKLILYDAQQSVNPKRGAGRVYLDTTLP